MDNMQLQGTVKKWLAAWDRGEVVRSVDMGGLGPGYEQCIQITMFELLRFLIDSKMPKDSIVIDAVRAHVYENKVIASLGGITGAQLGAAANLASAVYCKGLKAMGTDDLKHRVIMVSKVFPQVGAKEHRK